MGYLWANNDHLNNASGSNVKVTWFEHERWELITYWSNNADLFFPSKQTNTFNSGTGVYIVYSSVNLVNLSMLKTQFSVIDLGNLKMSIPVKTKFYDD